MNRNGDRQGGNRKYVVVEVLICLVLLIGSLYHCSSSHKLSAPVPAEAPMGQPPSEVSPPQPGAPQPATPAPPSQPAVPQGAPPPIPPTPPYQPAAPQGAPPPIPLGPTPLGPPPLNTGSPLETIDRLLQNLTFGNIAFNAPKTIKLGETTVIDLLLGLKVPLPELKAMVQAEGEKRGAQIRVSDRMEARLSGQDFSITAITPEVQAVSGNEITEWKWEIRPNSSGRHYLHLTLSALLTVDGASTPRVIRTYDQMIVVEVTWQQRASTFIKENWQWLWAAILVPVGGWLWKRKKKGSAGAA